jgi:hypothetical protein
VQGRDKRSYPQGSPGSLIIIRQENDGCGAGSNGTKNR